MNDRFYMMLSRAIIKKQRRLLNKNIDIEIIVEQINKLQKEILGAINEDII